MTSAGLLGRVLKSRFTHIFIFFVMLAAAFAVTWVFVRGLGWLAADAARWQKIAGYFARQVVPTLGAYLLFVRFIENRRARELDRRRALQDGVLGFAAGALLVVAAVGVLWLAGVYRVNGFNEDVRWANGILLAGLGAGIAEEIVFRGVLYRILEERLGLRWAIAISGLLFGALHIGNPGATLWSSFAIALEAGILFALVYHVTRSLWTCIGMHMGWNLFEGTIFGSNVSGARGAHSLLASSFDGPDWLSGGSFGIEASVVTVLICLAASAALLVAHRRRAADNVPVAAPTGGAPAC